MLATLDQELTLKFHVSQSTISENTITWVNFLYSVLGYQPLWASSKQVQNALPSAFKQRYHAIRVILDGNFNISDRYKTNAAQTIWTCNAESLTSLYSMGKHTLVWKRHWTEDYWSILNTQVTGLHVVRLNTQCSHQTQEMKCPNLNRVSTLQ